MALGKLAGKKGGKARWAGVPKAERKKLARKAARARWKQPQSASARNTLLLRGLENVTKDGSGGVVVQPG